MKVLHISTPFLPVTPDLKYGGSERVLYLLDQELHLRGLSTGVVAPHGSRPASHLYPTIPKAIGMDDLDKLGSSAFTGFAVRADHVAQSIRYANRLKEVDIVHLHDDNILPFDFLINRPSLITLHSDIDSFWDLSKTPFLKQRKSKFVSISQSQKRIYESRGHKVDYVVYNGVDEDKFSISESIYPYLLTLGSIQPVKKQDKAIEIAKRSGLDVVIAGNIGNREYFEREIKPKITHDLTKEPNKLAAYLDLPKTFSPRVVYVGPVNDIQKAPLFSHATAFLMPIDWEEPFGLVMVESMMSGTPVLAYNKGSVPEVVVESKTGCIVINLEEMVNAVKDVSRFNRGEVRNVSVSKFGKSTMVNNYIQVYQDILSQKS